MVEEKNINFTEAEIIILKLALHTLVDIEQDTISYTTLLQKLDSWYD